MIARLDDPWFEAAFYGYVTQTGHRTAHEGDVPLAFNEAQGLFLWCPCGYGKDSYPLDGGRPHGLLVPFSNPPSGVPVPAEHGPVSSGGGARPRWTVTGSGLRDLTLTPSVAVGGSGAECWHGFITNGDVL